MSDQPRMTWLTLNGLRVMVDDLASDHYGLDLAKRIDAKIGSVYPVLLRLEQAGWLTSHQEEVDPAAAGRPPRRLYRLTDTGAQAAREALLDAQRALAFRPDTSPGWAT
jgi:PadR family transcriptional regulator, regulatory protein PadR